VGNGHGRWFYNVVFLLEEWKDGRMERQEDPIFHFSNFPSNVTSIFIVIT